MINRVDHPLFLYARKVTNAVSCLLENHHLEAALVLIYSAIDHVAWLADENNAGENIGGAGFRAWVQKYMLAKNQELLLGATAIDLWGARSGILHTGAPENDAFRGGNARKIYYYTKLVPTAHGETLDSEGVLYLSINHLGITFSAGIAFFLEDLLIDRERNE